MNNYDVWRHFVELYLFATNLSLKKFNDYHFHRRFQLVLSSNVSFIEVGSQLINSPVRARKSTFLARIVKLHPIHRAADRQKIFLAQQFSVAGRYRFESSKVFHNGHSGCHCHMLWLRFFCHRRPPSQPSDRVVMLKKQLSMISTISVLLIFKISFCAVGENCCRESKTALGKALNDEALYLKTYWTLH